MVPTHDLDFYSSRITDNGVRVVIVRDGQRAEALAASEPEAVRAALAALDGEEGAAPETADATAAPLDDAGLGPVPPVKPEVDLVDDLDDLDEA